MSDQLFTDGDVHEINGQTFECVAVGYQDPDGEKQNFVYHFRLKSELDAERKAAEAAEAESADDTPAAEETVNQPEAPQEETHYVK